MKHLLEPAPHVGRASTSVRGVRAAATLVTPATGADVTRSSRFAFTRCIRLSKGDIVCAAESSTACRALLAHFAAIAKPHDGAPLLLLLFARLATRACNWLDGDLFIVMDAAAPAATRVTVATELGSGMREKVFPSLEMNVPLDEFTRTVERIPQMVHPLAAEIAPDSTDPQRDGERPHQRGAGGGDDRRIAPRRRAPAEQEVLVMDAVCPEMAEIAERRIGSVLMGKWRLERVLGAGGMATVYAATHMNNARAVAIKLLHPELASNADVRRRFSREGYIANKVGHPAAVAVLDDGVDEDGSAFLVMDLLIGQSLHDRRKSARGGVLGESEVLFVADGVLDVLAAAHAQGIIHRDLKPDNVFVTADGAVRVLDFGIARLVDRRTGDQSTQTGLLIGTPAYMSPEQAKGRSKLVDARSDVWAVGAILFTLLTGKHVHAGETASESLLAAMTTHAPPLASVLPGVSPAVAAIVDRALAYEPEERWPDARAMQRAVREARTKGTTRARDVLRRRRLRGGVALFALAIGGFALATSLLAPARLHRVGDAMTSITPVFAAADAGVTSASEAAPPRGPGSAPPPLRPPPARAKAPARPRGAR